MRHEVAVNRKPCLNTSGVVVPRWIKRSELEAKRLEELLAALTGMEKADVFPNICPLSPNVGIWRNVRDVFVLTFVPSATVQMILLADDAMYVVGLWPFLGDICGIEYVA